MEQVLLVTLLWMSGLKYKYILKSVGMWHHCHTYQCCSFDGICMVFWFCLVGNRNCSFIQCTCSWT